MAAIKYKGVSKLTELYEKARGKDKPTMRISDIGGAPGIPTEVVFDDTRIDQPLTAVWYQELRSLMDHAEAQRDYEGGNPNYPVIDTALREMTVIRKRLGQPT